MEADFWHQRWKAGEIGFHQDVINQHLAEYWRTLEMPSGTTVFVPLCGKSLDLTWLAGQGYKVIGVELSGMALRDFFAENKLHPEKGIEHGMSVWKNGSITIYQGDFFDLKSCQLENVKAVFDRASLIALPDWMRRNYVEKMQQLLSGETRMLLVTLVYNQAEMQGPPFSVPAHEVEQLYRSWCDVTEVASIDVLGGEPGFRKRGLTRLDEKVFSLTVK